MHAHEGLRYRGQAPSGGALLPPAASWTEEEPARAAAGPAAAAPAAAALPPAGPPSPASTLGGWFKSAFARAAGAGRDATPLSGPARAAAVAALWAKNAEERRRAWAGEARPLGAAVRDPGDYMHVCMYPSADALLLAKGGTLLPAHFSLVARGPFRRSAEYAAARAQRFGPHAPLILREPFSRFAPADVALLLRWMCKLPSEPGEPDKPPSFGRDGATEEEFKVLAALFVDEHVAARWWDEAGEASAHGGA
jgi:hypothetical protein